VEKLERANPWFFFVSIDPERLGGEPVFRDTRVPVRVLFEYLEGGLSIDQFLEDFEGVTRAQVVAVLGLARKTVENEIQAA